MPGNINASNALAYLSSGQAPGLAAQQQQYQNVQSQLNAIPQSLAQANAQSNYQSALQQAGIGISNQQLGIQGQQLGLTEQGQAMGAQLAGIQQGNEVAQYNTQKQQNLESYMYSLKNLQGQQAQSGALGTPGQFRDTANLSQNFNTQAQLAALGQASEVAGYQEQYGGGQFGKGQYGLTQQQNQLAQQNLALMAQSNGLSSQQVAEQLQSALGQNQQGAIQSANQYLAQLGNISAGEVTTEATAIAPIAYAGDLNPLAGGSL